MDDILIHKSDPEEEITRELVNELNEQINKRILKSIYKLSDPNIKRKEIFETAIKYKDKFQIISHSPIDYVSFVFINELIKNDINNGYITKISKDEEGNEYVNKYNLDDLESVTYIYDDTFDENKIIRWHRFKNGNKGNNESIFMPYDIKTFGNIGNYKNSDRYSVSTGIIPETQYNTFNIGII